MTDEHPTDPAPTVQLPREEPTREQLPPHSYRPPDAEPRPQRTHHGPTWPAVILGVACGILLGALVVLAIDSGGPDTVTQAAVTQTRTVTQTVTAPAPAATNPGTVVVRTLVPGVVGQRLDIAKRQLSERKFAVDVDGGGLLGVVRERNWRVTEQTPAAGTYLEQGSSVRVKISKG